MLRPTATYCPFLCECGTFCPRSSNGGKVLRIKIELNFEGSQDWYFLWAAAVHHHPSLLSVCHSIIRSCLELFWFPQTTKAEAFTLVCFVYYSYKKPVAHMSELSKSET